MKILILPFSCFLAHTTRSIKIAQELRKLNHDVIFAGAKKYVDLAKEEGFEVINIFDFNPEYIINHLKAGLISFHTKQTLYDFINKELEIYDQVKPDLVLSDSRFSCKLSARIAKLSLCSITNILWTKYASFRRTLPDDHIYITLLSKILRKRLAKKIINLLIPGLSFIHSIYSLRAYNYYLKKYKVAKLKNIEEVFEGELNLIADVKELVEVKELPPNYYFVGPILWEKQDKLPDWLINFKKEKSVIYLTMGSSGDKELFKKICKILCNKNYQLIVTTGGIIEKGELQTISDKFYVEDYIEGSHIMRFADVVIFHGGNCTMYQALKEGVPLIGIPIHFEQNWNIERIEKLKLGKRLTMSEIKENTLIDTIEEILQDKRYKENCLKFKEIINAYGGAVASAKHIDEYFKK